MNPETPTADPCFATGTLPVVGVASLPLVEELHPAPDAWQAALRLAARQHLLFLDSRGVPSDQASYSYLLVEPFSWLKAKRGQVWLDDRLLPGNDPFAALQAQLARWPSDSLLGLPPFQGGAAGLFGYDLCHHIERLPRPKYDDFEVPDLAVGFYDLVLAFEQQSGRAWLISTGFPETDPRRRRQRAEQRLRLMQQWLRSEAMPPALPVNGAIAPAVRVPVPQVLPGLCSTFDRETYLATARRAIEYVHAGDCFQVNIAQRLLMPAQTPALELYGRLRERNPAPFAGYFDLGEFVVASASPERFLRIDRGEIETRPIKGTRPRGTTPEADRRLIAELAASGKDRAENVMIVDLLRNDLGRVCRYGSARVAAVCQVETYQYVHHLVSVVRGRLREKLGPIDALRAAFPGGSVTGAPKVRAMEIIAELEPTARGPYCGSLGWIGFDGGMDTSILIRTFTIGKGWVQFPVGGGIVADSTPEQEYEETWHKAAGLLRALM